MKNKLFCKNYKTNVDRNLFIIYNDISNIAFFSNKVNEDYATNKIEFTVSITPTNQLDLIMQKVVEKTGCMVFGDYIVYQDKSITYIQKDKVNTSHSYSVLVSEVLDELAKHYAGQENKLEEFLN